MLIPSEQEATALEPASLSRRVNANSQPNMKRWLREHKLIKKGEC